LRNPVRVIKDNLGRKPGRGRDAERLVEGIGDGQRLVGGGVPRHGQADDELERRRLAGQVQVGKPGAAHAGEADAFADFRPDDFRRHDPRHVGADELLGHPPGVQDELGYVGRADGQAVGGLGLNHLVDLRVGKVGVERHFHHQVVAHAAQPAVKVVALPVRCLGFMHGDAVGHRVPADDDPASGIGDDGRGHAVDGIGGRARRDVLRRLQRVRQGHGVSGDHPGVDDDEVGVNPVHQVDGVLGVVDLVGESVLRVKIGVDQPVFQQQVVAARACLQVVVLDGL